MSGFDRNDNVLQVLSVACVELVEELSFEVVVVSVYLIDGFLAVGLKH